MKVLLINPPYTRIRGSGQSAYFPLGLGYLAGTLASEGFEPIIYNAENRKPDEPAPKVDMRSVFEHRSQGHRNYLKTLSAADHYVWREVRQVLLETKPDLVGISALSVQFGAAAKIAAIVKSWNGVCPVVIGGHHVTYLPVDTLQSVPQFDAAVLGEGEETFLELCRGYAQTGRLTPAHVPGMAYRSNDAILLTEPRKLSEVLDMLPNPRRDLVIFPERYSRSDFSTIIYGRGCPWRCRFCSSQQFWKRRVRMRSANHCLQEIKELMECFRLNHVIFWDDAFSVRRSNILEFCKSSAQSNLNFTFSTATRADLVDAPLLSALKQAGCVELTIGVESGSPRVLDMINKDLDLNVLREAVELVRKMGIAIGLFFMAGFPRETREDLQMTFDLIRSLQADRFVFNIFDPMPGSDLYNEVIAMGLAPACPNWQNFPLWPDAYFNTQMPREQFDYHAQQIADHVYRHNSSYINILHRHLPLIKKRPSALLIKMMQKLAAK